MQPARQAICCETRVPGFPLLLRQGQCEEKVLDSLCRVTFYCGHHHITERADKSGGVRDKSAPTADRMKFINVKSSGLPMAGLFRQCHEQSPCVTLAPSLRSGKLREGSVASAAEILSEAKDDRAGPAVLSAVLLLKRVRAR